MEEKTMTARFNDEEIIKTIVNSDGTIELVTLDIDGEEITHNFNVSLPLCEITFINNSSQECTISNPILLENGFTEKTFKLNPGESRKITANYGTTDGNMWGVSPVITPVELQAAASNPVNGVPYLHALIITDPAEDSSYTCTITDA